MEDIPMTLQDWIQGKTPEGDRLAWTRRPPVNWIEGTVTKSEFKECYRDTFRANFTGKQITNSLEGLVICLDTFPLPIILDEPSYGVSRLNVGERVKFLGLEDPIGYIRPVRVCSAREYTVFDDAGKIIFSQRARGKSAMKKIESFD